MVAPKKLNTDRPRIFLLDPATLMLRQSRLAVGDSALTPAYQVLLQEAELALAAGPFSVMDKSMTPPSGDKHDYYSMGPYWWPDPEQPDRLPYIRRDGEVNPERYQEDSEPLKQLIAAVDTLALAYYFSGDEQYADRAIHLLRVWFLNKETCMNPHLSYGQAIPGICDGRGIGIIDTRLLSRTVDAIGLLQGASGWTDADDSGLQRWFRRYAHWLQTSKLGRDEAIERNNHGTWYDVQLASFALFTNDRRTARMVLSRNAPRRIITHIEPDGRQVRELVRTRSLSYCTMNLLGLMDLATLAQHIGVDLWHHVLEDGQGIRRGLDWLIDNALDKTWSFQQITPFNERELVPLLRRAAIAYNDNSYIEQIGHLQCENIESDRTNLLYASIR